MIEQSKRDKALIAAANTSIARIFADSSKKHGNIEYDSAATIMSWREIGSKVT